MDYIAVAVIVTYLIGVTVVGALMCSFADTFADLGVVLGFLAVIFATINVVGGLMVTDRMLQMFRRRPDGQDQQ